MNDQQITPWSIYDKKLLRENKQFNSLKKDRKEKQRLISKNQANHKILERLFSSEKVNKHIFIDEQQDEKKYMGLNLDKIQNRDAKLISPNAEVQFATKKEMPMKNAQISQFYLSTNLDGKYREVHNKLRHNLMLKMIKKKLNQQTNLFEDQILNPQIFQPKQHLDKKIIPIFPQIKLSINHSNKIDQQYEPMSAQIKRNDIKTKQNLNYYKKIMNRSMSEVRDHLNLSERVLLAEELKCLEEESHIKLHMKMEGNNLDFLQKKIPKNIVKDVKFLFAKPEKSSKITLKES